MRFFDGHSSGSKPIGFDATANDDVAVKFNHPLYSGLQDLPLSVADWTTFVFQPDVILGVPVDRDVEVGTFRARDSFSLGGAASEPLSY